MEAFLHPNYDQHLHDPFLMQDMALAVERILLAVKRKERVVIYGDYDIDGITASAVMIETFRNLGHEATSYIPDRFEEGYGINLEALKRLKNDGIDLVVSVDCGVTSATEAAWAKNNGLDLVITDHHAVPPVLPDALAVINPKRLDDQYPFKDLAGVGVAFKLAQALQINSGLPSPGQEKWLLDLVVLGTVCDVVSLLGENRVLAKYGLMVMNKTRRPGLRALAHVSGVTRGGIGSYHLGYLFGPRMNAAGRLEHAARSLELMLTNDMGRAMEIADELDALNRQRQTDQACIFAEADEMARAYLEDPVLVLADAGWSHGIVGIVASKLVEKWRKPTLVMQILGEHAKGSGRSVGGFNLVEALRAHADHFIKFGGHYFAAGYTIPVGSINKLRQDLNAYFKQQPVSPEVLADQTKAEATVTGWSDLGWELYRELEQLEPFGSGNPKPVLGAQKLTVTTARPVGKDQTHLKLELKDGEGRTMSAIGFGMAAKHPLLKVGHKIDTTFQLVKNDFSGQEKLELTIVSIYE
jgi:single-stranded-DNA-specific exonuclease